MSVIETRKPRKKKAEEAAEQPRVLMPLRSRRAHRIKRFMEKYMPVPEGILVGQPMKLLPEQDDFLEAVYGNTDDDGKLITRTGILSVARKNGKALAVDTPIPTPEGFTAMGALRVGDVVFDEHGSPCRVTYKSKTFKRNDCYRVEFSDGSSIVADADHQWHVLTTGTKAPCVKTTRELDRAGVLLGGERNVYRWKVPVLTAPAQHSQKSLPLPPYTFGYWLGDGSTRNGRVTIGEKDLAESVKNLHTDLSSVFEYETLSTKKERTAYSVLLSDGRQTRSDDTTHNRLKILGVLHNKHIPPEYLTSSTAQRWALLQGLMDSDGTAHAGPAVPVSRRMCSYSSTNRILAEGVLQLVRSLGFKASMTSRVPTLNGKACSKSWRILFKATSEHTVFRLSRKQAKLPPPSGSNPRSRKNSITAIVPVKSVPTQCIQVDSASSLYLCGTSYTVTHNTGLISPILGAHLIGPEAKRNSMVYSAARSRDQAALVFNYLAKSLRMRNDLEGLVQITDSGKRIQGLAAGTEYRALSADATTAYGLSPALTIHDELGQVIGSVDDLYNALETAGGAQAEPLSLIISTQAASDADLLSVLIDDALRNPTPETVVRLYTALRKDCDLLDESSWRSANYALGIFRSEKDLRDLANKAKRMPTFEASFRNLYLNQRVSVLSLLVAPSVWRENSTEVDDAIFRSGLEVHVGADLSQTRDLTAVVLSVEDPDTSVVTIKPYVFTPLEGLEERAKQDRAPYPQWVKEGHLIALPGRNISYDMVCEYMAAQTDGMNLATIQFDRWRIELFKKAAVSAGFANDPKIVWKEVGQGFRDMSPRIEKFEEILLDGLLAHGNHPVMNMAAGNAVVVFDPAKNKKLEKAKSSARIDPLVAAVMSIYGAVGPEEEEDKPKHPPVTDKSFFFV